MTIPKRLLILFLALSLFFTQTAQAFSSLTWQSLQDTSTYASSQQSVGISVAIPIAGSGSVSGNYSKTNINSQYASVNEQTGIQAGDGGYAVKVKGDTTLVGGVIAASDKAIADNKLAFVSDGKVTQSDIQNQADYTANAVSVSAGVGGQVSASGGTGSDSGHASSITHSGIGISTKADSTGAIKPIFNAAKVNANLNAQVQITQSFSQQAPKAVGDYATSKLNEANTLRQQAKTETDPTKKTELTQQANALDANWGEGGMARVALHTAVGALSGGLAGAAGAGTSALSVPLIAAQINKLDVPPEVKQALILAAGTAVGGVTGGTAGAAAGLGQTGNNYLLHQAAAPQKSEAERYADAKKGCVSSDSRACQAKADLEMLSLSRDNQVANLCNGGADTCSSQIHTALANGSHLAWTPEGTMYVASPESPPALSASDTPNPRDGTFHQSVSTNLSQSLPIAGVAVAPEVAAMFGAGKIATGAVLGAGFDAAGQYVQMKPDEAYRPWQTAVAGVTGAIAYPLSGSSVFGDALLGGVTNATNTLMTNEMYGENDSVMWAAAFGAGFGGLGSYAGAKANQYASDILPTNIGASYINPSIPLFQQTINFGVNNPYPALIGAGVSNTIGGIPSFIPLPEAQK